MWRLLLRVVKAILALVVIVVAAAAGMAAIHGVFGTEWQNWAVAALSTVTKFAETIFDPAWWAGTVRFLFGNVWGLIGGSGLAGALLGAWYWGEIHFPSRIIELCSAIERHHRNADRAALLTVAQQGIGQLPTNIAMSKITFLRRLLSGWGRSTKEIAKSMAASVEYIAVEVRSLATIKKLADENHITALLVRGCHYEHQKDGERAFAEFTAATNVLPSDIVSRDWAAGCARRLRKSTEEKDLLEQIRTIAETSKKHAEKTGNVGVATACTIEWARAVRREAETLQHSNRDEASRLLLRARDVLNPVINDAEAKSELGRTLILYCEVQNARDVIGNLADQRGNAIGDLARMLQLVPNIHSWNRPSEGGGEKYEELRAARIKDKITTRRLNLSNA